MALEGNTEIGAAAAPNSCGITEDRRQVKAEGGLEGFVLAGPFQNLAGSLGSTKANGGTLQG